MLRAIWYYLYNSKNVKNTHAGVTLLRGCFSRFLNCTNGNKLRNGSYLYEMGKFKY